MVTGRSVQLRMIGYGFAWQSLMSSMIARHLWGSDRPFTFGIRWLAFGIVFKVFFAVGDAVGVFWFIFDVIAIGLFFFVSVGWASGIGRKINWWFRSKGSVAYVSVCFFICRRWGVLLLHLWGSWLARLLHCRNHRCHPSWFIRQCLIWKWISANELVRKQVMSGASTNLLKETDEDSDSTQIRTTYI